MSCGEPVDCNHCQHRNKSTQQNTFELSGILHNTGRHAIRILLERYKSKELASSDDTQLLDWFVEWCEHQADA